MSMISATSSTPLTGQSRQNKRKLDENQLKQSQVAEQKITIAEIVADFPTVSHNTSADGTKCQFCNVALSDYKALNIHKRHHHPQHYFACPNVQHCEHPGGEQTMFENVRELVSHYMQKHVVENIEKQSITCSICNQCYANRNGLNKHLVKHHNNEELVLLAAKFYQDEGSSHVFQRAPRWKK